jgi:hypothetical protein
LAAMKTTNFSLFSVSDAMLFIGAGYAGTDFIEGFMTTNSGTMGQGNQAPTNATASNKNFPNTPSGNSTTPIIDGSKISSTHPTKHPSHIK